MVLFMDGVTRPLAGTLYSVCAGIMRCHTVGTVVTEEDRRVYMRGELYGEDNG